MIFQNRTLRIAIITCILLLANAVHAQEFRSAGNGNWNALGTWEQFDGIDWVPATSTPTNASGAITVRAPHTVTVTVNVNLDDVTIESGATVTTSTGGTAWVIANGSFGVKVFGTFNANFSGGSFGCCGSVSVESGGVVNQNAGGSFFGPTVIQSGGTVIGNTPINLGAGALVNYGTWTMTGSNALTTTAGGSFTNNGLLTLRGYSLGGTLTNNNTINWASGIINGTGNIQNAAGGVFNIQFVTTNQLQVPFTNQLGGTVNQNGSGTFNVWAGTNFTNAGTLNLVTANWVTNGAFTNSGTIDIPAGRLLTFSSTTNLNAGTSITGAGSITSGGTTTQNCPWANGALSLTLSGGTWTSTAGHPLTFDAGTAFNLTGGAWINNSGSAHEFLAGRIFNWSAGTLGGNSGYAVAPGLTVAISNTGGKTLNSALTNNGTIDWSGGVINGTGNIQNTSGAVFNIQFVTTNQLQVPFTNLAGGTVNQNGSGTFNVWAGTHFTNAGTLNLVTANWVTNGTFTNSGTIDIPAGRLLTFASTTNLNTGTSFTGTGSITSGATTNQNFSWTNNTHALTISGGTWNNNSGIVLAFAPGGAFNWTAGALSGNSDYSIAAWLTVTLSTPSTKTLNRPLTNNGTVNWSEGVINGTGNIQNTNGAVFNIQFVTTNQLQVPFTNQLGGTVNQNGSGTFNVWSGTNFTNAGTLNLVSANWVTNGAFTNSGTIDIPAGRLLTFSSTTNLNAGTTITGAGAITSGGTTIQNFPWINSTHILTVSGGTWNNNSGTMLAFAPGSTFNWSGGTLAGAAGFEIHAGGTIASFSGATKTLNSILTNNGTINWSAGVINGTSAIGNTEGASMNISFSGANQLGVNLYNYGTLTYTGNGTFNTSVIFQNVTPGVLNVNAGQWHFNNLATLHSGTLNTLAGATAQFNFSTSVGGPVNNSGTLAGSISSFTGPTFTNNGSVTLTSLPFAGTATQTLDGTGTINNLTINNANGITLGGDQTVTGTLTFTNGKLTLGSSNLTLGLAATTSGQAAARYIVADGSGSLRRAINGANVLFPIGTTSSYLPATLSLTSGPQETFGVRVQDGVHSDYSTPGTPDGALVQNEQVERTWVITEQTAGGNQATVQLQWNAADEGSGFGRANSALHAYNGTDWVVLGLLGPASGSGPYTRSASAVAQFREFTVADGESTLAVACEGGVVPGASCDDGDPCTISDVVNAACACAGIFQDSDGDGICNAEDGCPNDANKLEPGACGCGVADVPATYYADNDSDGFGAGAPVPGFTCNVPSGHVTNNTDCNDSNPAIKPGAIELCNGIDDNCDGLIDNTNLGNGLVAYLSFNGTTSDGSNTSNNANAPSGSAYATGVNGTANGAFQFGGGRYVVLPHNAAYNLGTGDFTYSVWLNWSSTAYGSVIDKNNYSNGVFGLNCFVDYPGSGNFMARPGDVVTGTGLGNNTWHHVVTTRTGTTLRIYVNGALSITSTIASVNLNNTSNIFIGRHGNGAIQFYSGRMDNLRLYNRALSAAEVTELRNSELTGEVGGGTGILYYADQDGDGFGDPNSAQVSCTPIPGYVTNNTDGCPLDPLKQAPGACGCGNLETDTDGDGTPNCIDGCPNDPLKIAPLACGCGNPETDTDGDSTPDCVDGCPSDPLKTSAGACGCGNPDTDSDGDGIANCVDNCPNTPGQIGSPCNDNDPTTGNDQVNASCVCAGQPLDCLNVPGGSAVPGTACTFSGLPGIWSAGCVCELQGPDVAVQNVTAPNDTIAAEQSITLSWEVTNVGNANATVNWTERYYMESGAGANRVLLSQASHSSGSPLAPSAILQRSAQLTMPALINVGDDARFVVEVLPGTGLTELPNSTANNIGTQAQAWVVRKQLRLLASNSIIEGSSTTATVQRSGSLSNALVVNVGIDESERYTFPASVTILAGQSSRSFTLTAEDNALLEGPIATNVTVSATGFSPATRSITIIDNESPALSITGLPATTGEGTSVTFQVSTSFSPTAPLQVFLTSSDQARFAVPANVTIAANTTTASVTVNLPQDQIPELDITVTITAGALNHAPATATLLLTDDDVPGLALILQTDTVSESAGAFAVQATLQRTSGSSPIAFTAQLSASLPNTLLLPASISLAANSNQQTFTIGVVDNALVDGFRDVVINAAVQISGCGCGAPPSTAGNVSATLVVADNDGPSLSVTVTPATMAEGLANAGTLRVQRNTSTTEALAVTLFSTDVNELTLPSSVIIPIGASFLDVPITTVNDGTPDGSKQVFVQASTGGFSPGITWCIVTDVNQPDLIVNALSASSSPWAALTPFTWQATIANTGFANSVVGVPVRGVLSQNNIVDANDIVVFDYTINTPVSAGGSVQISGAAIAPNFPGAHKLLIQVNPGASVSELTYTNNTSTPLNVSIAPSYTAMAQVAGTSFLRGSTIPVTGTAQRPDASPAANESVEVYILTNGLRREVLATTNAAGQFTASFVPLANESGHYTVGASFPGMQQTTEQDAFDILGVRINNGQYPQFVVLIGDTLTGTLSVTNLSDAPLTNVTLAPTNVPAGAAFAFGTVPMLAGGATTNLSYAMSGASLTPGFNYAAASFGVTSDQGTLQTQDAYYYCQAPGGVLNASLTSITTTVSQAMGQRLVEFKLRNQGAGTTGAVSLSLPQVPWLSAMTPLTMPAIAQGDSALVILRFLAHASMPFGFPVNGTIVINATNSSSLVIPFNFTKVSVTTGDIAVNAVNQFTFFDPAQPAVAGATVEVRHAFSNALLAQGITDASGQFNVSNLPEGTHRLIVSKEQHLPYDGQVTINPGATQSTTTFLNYQAITFSWSVVPTTIQDQYNVTLNMVFQTNIPMPVVVMEMPDTMPQLLGNEVYAFNITMTNHGLVTAKDVAVELPIDSEYEFVMNYAAADLAALQSVQIPVLMRRRTTPLSGLTGESLHDISQFLGISDEPWRDLEPDSTGTPDSLGCRAFVRHYHWYYCSLSTGLWTVGGKLITFRGRECPPEVIDGGGWFDDYQSSTGASQWTPPNCPICLPPPPITQGGGWSLSNTRASCVECILNVAGALGECLSGPLGAAVADGIGTAALILQTAYCMVNAPSEAAMYGCIPNPGIEGLKSKIPCIGQIGTAAIACAGTVGASAALLDGEDPNDESRHSSTGLFGQLGENLQVAADALAAQEAWAVHLFGSIVAADAWSDFFDLIQTNVIAHVPFSVPEQTQIMAALSSSDIEANELQLFFSRWNSTMQANSLGVYSPNTTYPDIIDSLAIHDYRAIMVAALEHAIEQGYASILDMVLSSLSQLNQVVEQQSNAVCASVTVQLSQTVTMTREAFTGTLDIFNGHPTEGIDSLSVDIEIKNPDGVPSNGLFQINTEQLLGLSDVTGTGQIPSQEHGIVQFLFIPEIGAAPTVPVPYSFGGRVTYWDPYNQEMTTITLAPITLTVNPSPNLMLHYFMERNILGDDALTSPEVEPSIPAELAVMVVNQGYGPAQNLRISSAQPEIVENESGLAINFSLIGSNLQGQPAQLGVLNIPFGTIPPQSARIGQWWFTSSLLGKFVSYEASVVHANSFGNPELSLIQGVELHELTRSIREYGTGSDGMNDFLVNDQFDINDRPDIIYFSQGNRTEEVLPAASGSFNAPVSAPTFTNTLTLQAAEAGWNYIKLNDPGHGDFDLVSVTRQDGQSIPLANAWLTFVTLPVSQQPVYEDKFHFVDKLANTTPTSYSVVWQPKNTDVPAIDTIMGAPQAVSALQVSQLTVVFDKAIDPATFTVDDLTLTLQGGPNIMNASVIITQQDPSTFTVDLTALTTGNGLYTFTAQAAGVTDIFGISGVSGRQVSWTQFVTVPAIVAFQGLPGGATANGFSTIELLFNLPIDASSFATDDISITLGGTPQAGALAIEQLSSTLFRVSGLEDAINTDGAHLFTVDMTGVLSSQGEPGLQPQSTTLTRDNTGPVVVELTPLLTGGLDAQHRTGVRIRFNEAVSGLGINGISFSRGGQALSLTSDQLTQIDDDEWKVTGFGLESYPDGDYLFSASAAGTADAIGNYGSGSLSASWVVDRSAPVSVTNLNITPDLGLSNSDGISSTLSFNALFNLTANAAQVKVSQTSLGSEQVLITLQNVAAGPQSIPVVFPTGGNTGLKVTAIGANGGSASATKQLFLDQSPLSAAWQTTSNQSLTTALSSAVVLFSAALLDPSAILGALSLTKNGQPIPTASLTVTPTSSTTYTIGNLASLALGTGSFELRLDASMLNKASSGIAGSGSFALNWTVVPGHVASLRARAFLEGPYNAGTMHDSLRTLIDFPLTEPFTALGYAHVGGGGESVAPQVLAIAGNDAIVDWVIVELRDATDNTAVVASRSALLQRDGDVVATDGFSPVTMGIGAGAYHVAIRHRNHLGAMLADTARFYSGTTQVDFTLLSAPMHGTQAQKQIGARRALWSGDVSFDEMLMYVGQGNDRDPILVAIGGSTPTNTVKGYRSADVNLDGWVKYVGNGNDRDPILVNIGGSTPTNVREGQIPQP